MITRVRILIALCVFGLLVICPRAARAHDQWLEIDPFFSPAPGRTKVYLFSGEELQSGEHVVVRRRESLTRCLVASQAGVRDVTSELHEDQQPLAVISAAKSSGTFVVALDGGPRAIELGATKFQQYLLEERLIDALMWRAGRGQEDAPGRERYSRSIKAIFQVGARFDKVALQPVGQELEIVPTTHPYALSAGSNLSVQVLFQGKPLAGRAVTAANRFRGDVTKKTVRTDAKGVATFAIPRAGDWMFRLVHMEPVSGGDVDWRSYWTSLTFSLPDLTLPAPKR